MANVWCRFLIIYSFIVSAGVKGFDVHFWRMRPVNFLSKDGDDAACEKKNGRKRVYFPPDLALSFCRYYIKNTFSLLCTLTWRVNNYVSRQEKGINMKKESTKGQILWSSFDSADCNWLFILKKHYFCYNLKFINK